MQQASVVPCVEYPGDRQIHNALVLVGLVCATHRIGPNTVEIDTSHSLLLLYEPLFW